MPAHEPSPSGAAGAAADRPAGPAPGAADAPAPSAGEVLAAWPAARLVCTPPAPPAEPRED